MASSDTTIGGRDGAFPETVWASVLSSPDPASPARQAALNQLFRRYWRPVYAFVRAFWSKSTDDAKDLTQEFFCHLLEWDFVAQYKPDTGRFRHFLKGALRNFLSQSHRDATRLKRGGGTTIVPLDVESFEKERGAGDDRLSPEQLFDRQWGRELMTQAMAQLERESAAQGKPELFKAWQRYTFSDGTPPTYEALGRELSIAPTLVTHHLYDARRRFREILRERIAEYVTTEAELEGELHDLFEA